VSDPSASPTSLLAGLRVVDLTRVLAGPVCGRILADLGADVTKLAPPDGDLSREIAPKSERGLLVELDDGRGGTRPVVRAPFYFDGETCPIRRPAPQRGQHNAEVLRELPGFDDARIRALGRSAALVAPPAGAC